jgi:hypothetical protein
MAIVAETPASAALREFEAFWRRKTRQRVDCPGTRWWRGILRDRPRATMVEFLAIVLAAHDAGEIPSAYFLDYLKALGPRTYPGFRHAIMRRLRPKEAARYAQQCHAELEADDKAILVPLVEQRLIERPSADASVLERLK